MSLADPEPHQDAIENAPTASHANVVSDSLAFNIAERILELLRAGKFVDMAAECANHPDLLAPVQSLVLAAAAMEGLRNRTSGMRWQPGNEPPVGYEILREIARGGMGVVYEARQRQLNRTVAFKMVLDADPKGLLRFLAEAEAIAAVRHPNVVQVYDSGQHVGMPYLAMEYCGGGTLAARLQKLGRMAPRTTAAILAKVAAGVAAAHHEGIVHRDLKPGNVLFDAAGEPKVADFGLAKRGKGGDLTQTLMVMGTPAYMSPEQARGETKFVGPQADVWALGVILYECLTGKQPFAAETPIAVLDLIKHSSITGVRHICAEVPRDLELIAGKCLAKEPHDRYQSAAELAEDLERFLRGEPIRARPVPALARVGRWVKRNPYPTLLGLVLLLAAAGAVAVAATMRNERDRTNRAETNRAIELADSLIRQADITRTRPEAGRRARALDLLHEASGLLASRCAPDDPRWQRARDVALAAFHCPDLVPESKTNLPAYRSIVCDAAITRCALHEIDGRITIRALPGGQELFMIPAVPGNDFSDLGFSPDGQTLAVGRRFADAPSQSSLYDLTQPTRPPLTLNGRVLTMAFSPNGEWVCFLPPVGNLQVINTRTKAVVRESLVGRDAITARFSPDGRQLAVASGDNYVRIFDTVNWALLKWFRTEVTEVALGWSADGTRLVTGNGSGGVAVWEVSTSQAIRSVRGHADRVVLAEFDPVGATVVTSGWDHTVRVWDAATGTAVLTMPGLYARAGQRQLAIAEKTQLTVYRSDDGVGRATATVKGLISGVAFTPTGSHAVVTTNAGTHAFAYDLGAEREAAPLGVGVVESAIHHPIRDELYTHDDRGVVKWRFPPTGKGKVVLPIDSKLFARLAFDRTGRTLAAMDNDSHQIIVSLDECKTLITVSGGPNQMTGPSLTPDGRQVATGVWGDPAVFVWDVTAPTSPRRLIIAGGASALSVVRFSPCGKLLVVVASVGERVRVVAWRTADWSEVWSADGDTLAAKVIPAAVPCFSSDGRLVAHPHSTHGFTIREAATGRSVAMFTRDEMTNPVPHAFSPDGKVLVVSTTESRLEFWNLDRVRDGLARLGLQTRDLQIRSSPWAKQP